MTIKQLHYFISVAETHSFTHAARNYFIAQTAMSQQISALEKELGFRLFHRTNRSVALTEAGSVLLQRVRPLALQLEDAVHAASAVAGVENQVFRIGLSDQYINRFLTPALRAFAEKAPQVTPLLLSDNALRLVESICQGAMDAAILGARDFTPRAMLSSHTLFSYRVRDHVLAVPEGHPLSTREFLAWQDLQGLTLIAFSPLREDQQGAGLFGLLKEHGVTAELFCSSRSVDTALLYVEAGLGCCLLPAFAAQHRGEGCRMIPLEDDREDTMLLIHHKAAENPLLGEFLSICRKTIAQSD